MYCWIWGPANFVGVTKVGSGSRPKGTGPTGGLFAGAGFDELIGTSLTDVSVGEDWGGC